MMARQINVDSKAIHHPFCNAPPCQYTPVLMANAVASASSYFVHIIYCFMLLQVACKLQDCKFKYLLPVAACYFYLYSLI